MKKLLALPLAIAALAACEPTYVEPDNGLVKVCPAGDLQNLVGMNGYDAFVEVNKMPDEIKNTVMYAGEEEFDAPNIPRGTTLVIMNTPDLMSVDQMATSKVVSVQCKV